MNSYQDLLVNSVTVLSEAESNSICTGAVIVNGGVGIKGNLYVGGCIVGNNINNGGNGGNGAVNFTSIGSNMLPSTTNCFNIGSSSKKWKNLYISDTIYCDKLDVNTIQSCNTISITNNVCITGNLNVTGTITENGCQAGGCNNGCGNSFDNKTLTIGCSTNTESEANGSGLIINIGNPNTRHLLWYTGTTAENRGFELDDAVTIKGNLIVDGSIQSSNCGNNINNIINYDLIPLCTNTFSIGQSSKKWKNIYLAEEFHIGINNDFVTIDAPNKIMSINGSSNNYNSVYGNSLHIIYTGCTNSDANILRLTHTSGISGGSKIQFDIDANKSCTIGANYINTKQTFVISVNDHTNCNDNNEMVLIDNSETNIMNNTIIHKSLSVTENISYDKNLVHSLDIPDLNCNQIDTTTTFSEISIDEEYKELTFTYNIANLQSGHIKYFIVTNITASNCGCGTPHYKILVNDLIGGSALILSSLGQSVGLVWTSQNKWLVFSGIACIVV